MTGEDFWEDEERRSVKTIRVVLAWHAVGKGRLCASFLEGHPMDAIDRSELGYIWSHRGIEQRGPALVDVPINTLEPTDDGAPDELALCEQAQREDRP